MKKLLLFYFLQAFIGGLNAQNLNSAMHSGLDETGAMISINSKCFYLEKTSTGCCYSQVYLVGLNEAGQVIFKTDVSGGGAPNIRKLIKTKDNSILVLANSLQACDVASEKDFIYKVDTNGTVIFFKTIQSSYVFSGNDHVVDLVEYSDSSFFLVSSVDVLNYSKTGQFLNVFSSGLSGINSITCLNNGLLVLNGTLNNVLQNVKMTTSFSIISNKPSNSPIGKFLEAPNGELFGLSKYGVLEKYDSTLNYLISCSALSSANIRLSAVIMRSDSLFATGTNTIGNLPYYAIIGQSLNVEYQTQANYKNVRPSGIAISGKNKINIISTGSSNIKTEVSFAGFYQLGINGVFNSMADVGVRSFSINTAQIFYYSSASMYLPVADLAVCVKNFGTDTVKNFYLNHYISPSYCPQLFHKLYQTTLLPGDSIVVNTGTFNISSYFSLPSGSPSGTIGKIKICLFTTIPNESNDIEISNDSKCDSVGFVLTGLDDIQLLDLKTKIFPNPFNEAINIQSDFRIQTIELTNALGSQIHQAEVNAKNYKFGSSWLGAGIYFIKITTEEGSIIKKVIKN